MLNRIEAIATTVRIEPGTERTDDQGAHIRNRTFTDRVQSSAATLDGTNRVTLDLDIDARGAGVLRGVFELVLTSGKGTWTGEVQGHFENGMVVAEGLAHGTGAQEGAVLHIGYRQIPEHPGSPPVDQPLAVFDMRGVMLQSPPSRALPRRAT
jgi:hypothetical protein